MNVLIVDCENMQLDFALRCAAAGHSVRLFPDPAGKSKYGEGFKEFEIVADYKPYMEWAKDGLILLSGNYKYTTELDRYKELGFKIFAPSKRAADLELDRKKGMDAMKAAGIDLLPYHNFNSLDEAERFARKADQTYVFKALDGAVDDKALTYVSRDPADMCGWLKRQIKCGTKISKCMLQDKIEVDFEIGINGWFGPEGFLPDKYQISFEHKPFMPGDIGPQTGEMISLSQYVEHDQLVDEMLTPMVPILKALEHRGDFCIGCIIDKTGKAWPLEITSRLGYPAFFGQVASHKGDPAKWMRDLLDGKDSLKVSEDPCFSVVLAQPPFPYKYYDPDLTEGNPITIDDDAILDDLHFCGVMKGKGPTLEKGKVVEGEKYLTTGPYVMVVTGSGSTLERARKKVYRTIEQVHFPCMLYRNDGGEKVAKALPSMHSWGYALEMDEK